MDKRVIKFLALTAFCIILLYTTHAQNVPQPVVQPDAESPTPSEIRIIQQVKTEQQATRKFIIDTFQQKSEEFFTEADNRISYVENKLDSALDTAVISLSILWGAITLFVVALFTMFSRLMDRARYKKLEKAITENVTKEMSKKVEIKDGYVNLRQFTPDEAKAERDRILAAQQKELEIKLREEQIKRQIQMLQEQFNGLRKPQQPQMPIQPQSPQNVPTFNVPPKPPRQPYYPGDAVSQ
jgi:hypothetical protein